MEGDSVTKQTNIEQGDFKRGMIGNSSLLAAGLTVGSVVSLGLLSLLCLRCKRKSQILQVESQIYNHDIFQRGGSRFAVMRSKTVTRANQFTSTAVENPEDFRPEPYSFVSPPGNLEYTYVAPLVMSLYENDQITERMRDANQMSSVYANIDARSNADDDEDEDCNYENAGYLEQNENQQEDDEPDYVNEKGQ